MLVIQGTQIRDLRGAARRAFEDEMVAHLAVVSPRLTAAEQRRRNLVRRGIDRAVEYGLTLRGPMRLYLELMALLGSHFDTDPRHAWAAEVLSARAVRGAMGCAHDLHLRAVASIEETRGLDDASAMLSHPHASRADAAAWDSVVQPCATPMVFTERLRAVDPHSGAPIVGLAYRIELDDGSVRTGETDEDGRTGQVMTAGPQLVRVVWGEESSAEPTDDGTDDRC